MPPPRAQPDPRHGQEDHHERARNPEELLNPRRVAGVEPSQERGDSACETGGRGHEHAARAAHWNEREFARRLGLPAFPRRAPRKIASTGSTTGRYIAAADKNALASAFDTMASIILRLSQ
jgi:hypothetical protein